MTAHRDGKECQGRVELVEPTEAAAHPQPEQLATNLIAGDLRDRDPVATRQERPDPGMEPHRLGKSWGLATQPDRPGVEDDQPVQDSSPRPVARSTPRVRKTSSQSLGVSVSSVDCIQFPDGLIPVRDHGTALFIGNGQEPASFVGRTRRDEWLRSRRWSRHGR